MPGKRRKYSPQFKFDRAIEAVRTGNLSEISRKYGISANVLSNWRSELMKRGSRVFASDPDRERGRLEARIARLEQMLGKKEVELNVLKNFSDFYGSRSTM